jgi:predicted DNA-binding transcriptional regulator YafY
MALLATDQVLALLSDGQIWSGQRIAEQAGLSLRTVRRAVAALREEGVVIETDIGRGGGMRLGARSALPRLQLAHQEAVSLLVALALAESLRLPVLGGNLRILRAKLSTSFQAHERSAIGRLRNRMLIGEAASESVRKTWQEPDLRAARLLQEAFVSSRVVQFRYVSRDNRTTERNVEPQYLLLNYPAWYMLGFDRISKAGRTFRLDGIRDVRVLDDGFKLVAPDALQSDVRNWFRAL